MSRVCKQVSIESPASVGGNREYVFQYDVVVPDVPPRGARVKVISIFFYKFLKKLLILLFIKNLGDVRRCVLPPEVRQREQLVQHQLYGLG